MNHWLNKFMIFSTCRRQLIAGVFFILCGASSVAAKEFPLRNEALAHTEQGRQLLKYLVSCALPAQDSVVVNVQGQRYVFQGMLGGVPAWVERALTDNEKRILSACMAARTNFFQKTVRISLRSDDPAAPEGFQTTVEERETYPFFEASFFGNYFVANPVSYVCLGDQTDAREQHMENVFRVCSLPHESLVGYSRCNFKIVGKCKDKPFVQNGVDYSKEVLWVYLPAPID